MVSSKFSIGDIVVYDNKVYKVVKIYAPNWNLDNPFVYGLALLQSDPAEPVDGKLVPVREPLMESAPEHLAGVWKVLYGK